MGAKPLPLSNEQKEEITLLYKQGELSSGDIGKKFGCSGVQIRSLMKRSKISKTKDSIWTDELDQLLQKALASGRSMQQFGDNNEIGIFVVRRRAKKLGINVLAKSRQLELTEEQKEELKVLWETTNATAAELAVKFKLKNRKQIISLMKRLGVKQKRQQKIDWTEDKVEKLKQCRLIGMSFEKIGTLMGIAEFTVRRKVVELGLPLRLVVPKAPKLYKPTKNRKVREKTVKAKSEEEDDEDKEAEREKKKVKLELFELPEGEESAEVTTPTFAAPDQCNWPFGDKPVRFCCEKAVPNLPYCLRHCQCAYNTSHAKSRFRLSQNG